MGAEVPDPGSQGEAAKAGSVSSCGVLSRIRCICYVWIMNNLAVAIIIRNSQVQVLSSLSRLQDVLQNTCVRSDKCA